MFQLNHLIYRRQMGSTPYMNFARLSNTTRHFAFTEQSASSTPLVFTMQFILCIITTFTLFGISAYANPVPTVQVAEVPREVATYCGGYGLLTCNTYCTQTGKTKGTCTTTYVNNSMIRIQDAD